MESLISAKEAARLVGVTKKVIYDAEELKPVLQTPRIYRLDDVRKFAKLFEKTRTGHQIRRKRTAKPG